MGVDPPGILSGQIWATARWGWGRLPPAGFLVLGVSLFCSKMTAHELVAKTHPTSTERKCAMSFSGQRRISDLLGSPLPSTLNSQECEGVKEIGMIASTIHEN